MVYRALYEKVCVLAIKRLKVHPDGTLLPELYGNCIKRKARYLRNMLQTNIVQFRGIIWEPNFLATTLEYNAYGDLLNFMKKYNLHPYLKAKLLFDVSKGINYHHWLPKQIIRDYIKASNVLISENVSAKLTDFELTDWNSFVTAFIHAQPQSKY